MKPKINMRVTKFLFIPCVVGAALLTLSDMALARGSCGPVGAVKTYNANLTSDVGADFNKAGKEVLKVGSWKESGGYQIECACYSGDKIPGTYYWAEYVNKSMPVGHANGWYSINEYLDVRLKAALWDQTINDSRMLEIPFGPKSNNTQELCPSSGKLIEDITTGSKGELDIYIKKPFVGNTVINYPNLYVFFASLASSSPGYPIARVSLSVNITAPQSCEINAGQSISIPFNDAAQRNFVAAGKGGMPAGVVPQSKTLSIKCSNMDAYANLDMRFIGTADPNRTNDGFSTTNKDIAIAIEGPNGRLTPTTGKLPLQLDSNQNGSVTIKTYPISSTGLAPDVGKYSSIVTVRLDFR
ncbi:fimbrial protein [Providencia rettgeri]|uniref:fimbrial protein n=1 Tax=Providencia rettgeri TaxID=587 RepID=UPI001373A2B3|nr:fimbrial protein [Providencia rettgeri]MCG9526588.1 fimbrial protein [Providencia rettgeri]BBV03434.1 fimbrial protein [Providencia rettgeri]